MKCSVMGGQAGRACAWVLFGGLCLAGCTGYLDLDGEDAGADASTDGGGADGGDGGGSSNGGGDGGNNGGGDGGGTNNGGDDDGGGNGGTSGGDDGGGSGNGGTNGGGEPGRVSAFVAQGDMGRLTISCDGGRSWVANRSLDDAARCGTNPVDCEEHEGGARGVAYGDGVFVATFGWGFPGELSYSGNGVDWGVGVADASFAGVAFGDGTFVANAVLPQVSDDGMSWQQAAQDLGTASGPRRIGYVPYGGGRFVSVTYDFGSSVGDAAYSSDGDTWQAADSFPGECGFGVRSVHGLGDVIVSLNFLGQVCRSTDGGQTWTMTFEANEELQGPILDDGNELMFWGQGAIFRSSDGMSWSQTATSPPSFAADGAARSPDGTFVAVTGAYDSQVFYRSEDGINWDVLDSSAFEGSHRILYIAHGWVDPDAGGCPAP